MKTKKSNSTSKILFTITMSLILTLSATITTQFAMAKEPLKKGRGGTDIGGAEDTVSSVAMSGDESFSQFLIRVINRINVPKLSEYDKIQILHVSLASMNDETVRRNIVSKLLNFSLIASERIKDDQTLSSEQKLALYSLIYKTIASFDFSTNLDQKKDLDLSVNLAQQLSFSPQTAQSLALPIPLYSTELSRYFIQNANSLLETNLQVPLEWE